MLDKVTNFLRDEEGASAVEYALIIGLIAIAIIVVLGTMSGSLQTLFGNAATALDGAAN
ncbi:Flp family type IVb pilin [Solimonas marina]|uniref:Flp family type IVb pilin n=1 Tax=Solimonas marina TaxID=2714601 RepID=A0A969W686_9GAMM|nr:Flp family type IVb pilin [Solimonas marina]NKF21416.1 Flp family type IVb pilin [Solimonas marina]